MTQPATPDDDLAPDPHLRRMLAHAPDVELRPAAATRAAILAAARHALAEPGQAAHPAAPGAGLSARVLHWLDRWLPRASMPWSAALATVVLATVITLMWQGEPLPQAQPDGGPASAGGRAPPAEDAPAPRASPQAPPAAPAPAAQPPAPAGAAADPPPTAEAALPQAAERRAQAKTESLRVPPGAGTSQQAAPQARAGASAPASEEGGAGAGAAADRAEAPARAAALPVPPPPVAAQAPRPPAAPQAERSEAGSPAVLAAPASPAGAASSRAQAEPAAPAAAEGVAPSLQAPRAYAPAAAPRVPEAWHRWTHVQLADAQGRILTVDRARAEDLAALLPAVVPAADAPARDAALPAAVDGRLTLLQDGRSLGTLEIGGGGVRWHAAGAAPVFAAPSPPALQALRAWLAQAQGHAR